VHETLSTSSAESVLFDEVYERIVHNAIELSPRPITPVKIGDFGILDAQVATPLALVVTELIHNSLEHGLADSGDIVRIEVSRSETTYTIKVIDNGIGLPVDFDWEKSSNLGLQIVRTLTENELKGSITLNRVNDETVAMIVFKV